MHLSVCVPPPSLPLPVCTLEQKDGCTVKATFVRDCGTMQTSNQAASNENFPHCTKQAFTSHSISKLGEIWKTEDCNVTQPWRPQLSDHEKNTARSLSVVEECSTGCSNVTGSRDHEHIQKRINVLKVSSAPKTHQQGAFSVNNPPAQEPARCFSGPGTTANSRLFSSQPLTKHSWWGMFGMHIWKANPQFDCNLKTPDKQHHSRWSLNLGAYLTDTTRW